MYMRTLGTWGIWRGHLGHGDILDGDPLTFLQAWTHEGPLHPPPLPLQPLGVGTPEDIGDPCRTSG